MNIAKRIRTLRQARHMTQSDLAGDQISREMISMIETGRIQPSLETLQYIARQLDITPAQILADETEEGEFQATALREKMFRRYDAGDWDAAIALAQSSEGVDDGVCLLLCQCYVRRGAACYENQKLSEARDAFNRALWYSQRTRYDTTAISGVIARYQYLLDELYYGSGSGNWTQQDFVTQSADFFRLISAFHHAKDHTTDDVTGTPFFQDVCYRHAFDGARRMEQGAYAEAKKIFTALLERQMPPDPALQVYVLQSLEHCCAECQDFRAAYQYSVKRLALLQQLKQETKEESHT